MGMEISLTSAPSPVKRESIGLADLPAATYIVWVTSFVDGFTGNPNYTLTVTGPDPAGPNLSIDQLSQSTAFAPVGGQIDVTATIANNGNQPSGASIAQYYLSDDALLDRAEDTLLHEFALLPLNAGDTVIDSQIVTIPAGTRPGQMFLVLIIDTDDQVAESGETDNAAALGVAVLPEPDVNESNDNTASATRVELIDGGFIQSGLTVTQGDLDYFAFNLDQTGGFNEEIRIDFNSSQGRLVAELLDVRGQSVREGLNEDGLVTMSLAGLSAGDYVLVVRGSDNNDYSSAYTVTFDTVVIPEVSNGSAEALVANDEAGRP